MSGRQGHRDPRALQGHRDKRATSGPAAPPENRDHKAKAGPWAQLEIPAPPERRDRRGRKEKKVRPGQPCKAPWWTMRDGSPSRSRMVPFTPQRHCAGRRDRPDLWDPLDRAGQVANQVQPGQHCKVWW